MHPTGVAPVLNHKLIYRQSDTQSYADSNLSVRCLTVFSSFDGFMKNADVSNNIYRESIFTSDNLFPRNFVIGRYPQCCVRSNVRVQLIVYNKD